MLTQTLIAAGKETTYFRQEDGETSLTYKLAIDKIDEVNHYIRASHPERYWNDSDPGYQHLTSTWEAARAVRKAKNVD